MTKSFVASGFAASGLGSLFQGDAFIGGSFTGDGVDDFGNARSSQGFILQAMYTLPNGKVSFGGSYGQNRLKLTSDEQAAIGRGAGQFASRGAWVGQFTYFWTKSLRFVAEYTNFNGKTYTGTGTNSQTASKGNQGALGLMLFF